MPRIPVRRYDASGHRIQGVVVENSYTSVRQIDGADLSSHDAARTAADAMADKKGLDIRLLDVARLIAITDVFVIATGTSRPHVQALTEIVVERMKTVGRRPLRDEGRAEAEWVLIDFGDFVVHVFQETQRDYYSLERLWSDAPVIEWRPAPVE